MEVDCSLAVRVVTPVTRAPPAPQGRGAAAAAAAADTDTGVEGYAALLPATLPHWCDGRTRFLVAVLVCSAQQSAHAHFNPAKDKAHAHCTGCLTRLHLTQSD